MTSDDEVLNRMQQKKILFNRLQLKINMIEKQPIFKVEKSFKKATKT